MRLRSIKLALCVALMCINVAYGEEKQLLEVGSFTAPDSPAFEALGVSPSSVARPGSAKELAVSLFSSSVQKGSFPRNLAIEFSPYWWTYHTDLTWNLLNPKEEIIANNLLQTFSVSIATSKTTSIIDDVEVEGTGLGVGARVSLLKGRPSKAGFAAYEKVKTVLAEHADELIPDDISSLPQDENGNRIVDLNDFTEEVKTIGRALETFRSANRDRVGLRLELAGAGAFDFPEDKSEQEKLKSVGVWMTAAYRTDEGSFLDRLDFLGVFRFLRNRAATDFFETYDLGARIFWTHANPNFPFSASTEYVHRYMSGSAKQDSEKFTFIAEYRVNKDWSIFASAGQTFDQNFDGNENFATLFGLNFGYGKGPVVAQ